MISDEEGQKSKWTLRLEMLRNSPQFQAAQACIVSYVPGALSTHCLSRTLTGPPRSLQCNHVNLERPLNLFYAGNILQKKRRPSSKRDPLCSYTISNFSWRSSTRGLGRGSARRSACIVALRTPLVVADLKHSLCSFVRHYVHWFLFLL